MFYEELFSALNAREIRYLVVGGVAVALHGALRMTADLDLMVALDRENALKFVSAMKALGYLPKAPVQAEELADAARRASWRAEKGMLVFSWHHPKRPEELIDTFTEETIPFEAAYGRRVEVRSGEVSVPLVSIPDLISLKERAARPQDLADNEKPMFRVVQHFSDEKLAEFKALSAQAKLRWLEGAVRLVYRTYVSSGRKAPYDPQNWPYI